MDLVQRLKVSLGIKNEEQDELLESLLDRAKESIIELCNREDFPIALASVQCEIALILYNRLGAEGSQGKTEGPMSETFFVLGDDLPKSIRYRMHCYRKPGYVKRGSNA